MESMTNAPHLLIGQRAGLQVRRRDDARPHGASTGSPTRTTTARWASRPSGTTPTLGIGRAEQDAFGAAQPPAGRRRRRRTARFAEEIAPVELPQRRASRWSSPRTRAYGPTPPPRRWRKLRPAFGEDGTITAGTSSPISDGACAVVVMSRAKAEELGLTWLAEIGAHGSVAGPDNSLHAQPANAIAQALAKDGPDRGRPRPGRDQRGVRGGRHPVHKGPGRRPGHRQRQRRRDRAGPPDRHVRRPAGADPRAGAAPPRRRAGRGRPVRRRRPGRRAASSRVPSTRT